LPDTFYESLHSDVDSTHLEQDADSLVARIHDVLFDFTFDAPVATTSLCVKPRVLVSAHVRPWRSIDQLRAEEELQNLQQAAEKFSTAISDTAALVERVKQLQEELAAFVNEQTNRTLFVLTVVTVLALPINLVAGLFGMNVGGIPLAQHPYGFFLVVGPLLVLTAFLAYWGLGRRRD
jgi:Mg2+ and Co2+ transporter CorA